MARWVIHEESLDQVNTEPVMRDIADAIARDAIALAPVDTGELKASIRVSEVSDRHAIIEATPRNPDPRTKPEDKPYAFWVEKGTSDTAPRPFLRPAAYRYRS